MSVWEYFVVKGEVSVPPRLRRGTQTHGFHRSATVIARGDFELFIPHSRSQLDIPVRVQLFLPLSELDLLLKLVPRRVQRAQSVLERVPPCRGMTREAVRVPERAVEFEDRGVESR